MLMNDNNYRPVADVRMCIWVVFFFCLQFSVGILQTQKMEHPERWERCVLQAISQSTRVNMIEHRASSMLGR